jgi:predicted esterase
MKLSRLLLALALSVAIAAPAALANTAGERTFGWELFARPAADAARDFPATRPGEQSLPDIPWADVYIPRSYRPDKPAPMALLLHGSGDRGRTMIEEFSDLAELHGVILVAPDSQRYSWDIMVKGAELRNTTRIPSWGNDVDRIDKALARAFALYNVDPNRISLLGFSDGAGYGLSLGANNGKLFSAVMAFAPGLLTRIDGQARNRIFLAHGENDRTLPMEPTRDIFAPALQRLGYDVTLELFEGRHVMPHDVRAEAFAWWLHPHG